MPRIVPTEIDVLIGQRIRERRKAHELSIQALADRVGISYQQFQKYENGQNKVAASTLAEISEELDTPIEYFYSGNISKKK